jgi:hypothetical protein
MVRVRVVRHSFAHRQDRAVTNVMIKIYTYSPKIRFAKNSFRQKFVRASTGSSCDQCYD